MTRLALRPNPIVCPGGYTIDAYCKWLNGESRHDYLNDAGPSIGTGYGQTRREAAQLLRRAGWILHRDGTATCPTCAKLLKGKP